MRGIPSTQPGMRASSRKVALDALVEIDASSAYANLKLGPILERSGLDQREAAAAGKKPAIC